MEDVAKLGRAGPLGGENALDERFVEFVADGFAKSVPCSTGREAECDADR